MDIPKHYEKSHGFWSVFEAGLPSVVETILPVTSDRYHVPLTDDELRRYNGYLQTETVIDLFGRMLSIIRENIVETAAFVTGKP